MGIAKRVGDEARIYAVDISRSMLDVAQKNAEEQRVAGKIIFLQADGKKLNFDDNHFDLVMCSNMLHHLKNPVSLLNEMKRVAKDEGIVIIRDVIRPPTKFILDLFVNIFGSLAGPLMKNDYRISLAAGFTVKEHREMMEKVGLIPLKVSLQFPHYVTLISTPV